MPNFFIDRPVFAWVISILICLGGVISMLNMGVAAYPDIAPPQVTVNATYPGANAATMESTVTQVIEQQLTGIDNLLYFTSTSNSNGTATITLSFATGTNQDIAEVQVQNKVALAQPLLPTEVTQQGVIVAKASPDILLFVALSSDNPSVDAGRLSDILASRIQPVLARNQRHWQHVPAGLRIRDPHLAGYRQAARLRALCRPGAECHQRAKRAVRHRLARCGSGRQRSDLHGHRIRRYAVLLAAAVQ